MKSTTKPSCLLNALPVDGYDPTIMLILSADTSTRYNSVAVCDDEHVLAESIVDAGRRHSERLLETVDWVLNEVGLDLGSIQLLAISKGPGSFTGLRVGVATWKGLSLAARLPLVGVSTLDAITRLTIIQDGVICPLLDARMQEVFGAIYGFEDGIRQKLIEDRVAPVEEILELIEGDALFLGEGAALYHKTIQSRTPGARFAPDAWSAPRGSAVAAEALHLFRAGAPSDGALLTPVYLRKSQAEVNRAKSLAAGGACP